MLAHFRPDSSSHISSVTIRGIVHLEEVSLMEGKMAWHRLPESFQVLHLVLVLQGSNGPSDRVTLRQQLFDKF